MHRRLIAPLLGTLVLAAPIAAPAQNFANFSEAAQSPIAYTRATTRPQLDCGALRAMSGGELTVTRAVVVAAADGVPEHCRVSGVIAPEIGFEINLPSQWNRRFYMFGNGGYAGEHPEFLRRPAIRAAALKAGFLTASTNTGHDAQREPLATFAVSVQKTIDYAFRAVHLTAVTAKQVATRYYDRPVAYSYWDGCSTGGRQGLMAAQRFPGDFDGIVDGAPVLNFVDSLTAAVWNGLAVADSGLTVAKLKTVAGAVYAKCDAIDGLKDGLIDDPRRCGFDAAKDVPQCAGSDDGDGCLTPKQAAAIQHVHSPMVVQGKPYFFGYAVGDEVVGTPFTGAGAPTTAWDEWFIGRDGQKSRQVAYGETFMKYLAFGRPDPNFDIRKLDFDKDPARMGEMRALLDATDPDLRAFRGRGGKLLMYHGWADTALTPYMSIDYYEKAQAASGADGRDFFRLFMVPGMAHCRGGVATDRFDAMSAIVNWVENGSAPNSLKAWRVEDGKVARSRPLCPFPQVAVHAGTGSPDDAANFSCKNPN
ncbi:MAG: tannase/feruloyl esterase family alpha/beta hydrolase [Proteobacteria bacterium]|nr:tannase/feruloyl esterase family alpha/beta hydrolase [Pseudomonadota bacterium]